MRAIRLSILIFFCMEACLLPMAKSYSRPLFYTSFSFAPSSMVSFYFQDYTNGFMMFLLFLTSIQFWYRPDYGIRRNIDMTLCKILAFYYYLTILYDRDEYYSMVLLFALSQICFLYIGEMILVAMYNPKWIVLHMAMHIQVAFYIPFFLYML